MTCTRDDGSVTWTELWPGFGGEHDLTHYAVESVLGYTDAFFGMLARGRDIDSFGTRDGVRDTYSYEETWAEHIVGTLQFSQSGDAGLSYDAFCEALSIAGQQYQLDPPVISAETLRDIRARITELVTAWRGLPRGEQIYLPFPPA